MLTPYIGAGARQWGRNLPGASGYHEDYSHGYVGGGLMAQFALTPDLVVSVDGLVGSSFAANMTTSRTPGGFAITPQSYALGSSAIYQAGVSLDYAMTKQLHANAGIDYTSFKYGRSATSPIDTSYEPDSRTSQVVIKIGLGYAF
jgi:hypothetical protein